VLTASGLLFVLATPFSGSLPMVPTAGELPGAIAYFRRKLEREPWDRTTQNVLTELRARVNAPREVQPPAFSGLRFWVSPSDLAGPAAVFGLLVAVGLAKGRRGWRSTALGIAGWFLLLAVTIHLATFRHEIVVTRAAVALREGNDESYPALVPIAIPAGVECEVVGRRGEWCRVRVGQLMGWVPTKMVE
jgi:hypothetical protein